MAEKQPSSGTPDPDMVIARTDGTNTVFFPDHSPAVDFKRAILAREHLLQDTFNDMREAWDRMGALKAELAHRFPGERSYTNTSKEQRDLEDEIASLHATSEDAAVNIVMTLQGLFEALGRALGKDSRALGDEIARGITFSKLIWALGNRQRHVTEWRALDATQRAKNESIQVLEEVGVDPLSGEATFEALKKCGFKSYDGLQKCIISVPDAVLASSGLQYEVSASGYRINLRIR